MASTRVYVKINEAEIQQLLYGNSGPVVRDLDRRGTLVLNEAKRRCPVDTGRLRSSITKELGRIGRTPVVRVGTNVEYAPAVHDGYRGRVRVRPQPFLTDALAAAGG